MSLTKSKPAIGIVGGVGPYAGLDLEKKVFDCIDATCDQDYPDVIMISASGEISDRTYYIMHPETDNPCTGIEYVIQRLANAGATHIGIPCNTAHSPIIMNQVRKYIELNGINVKLLNIVEETYKWVKEHCKSRDLVLYCTMGTYASGIYRSVFSHDKKFNIIEPDDDDKQLIWNAIYNREYGIKAFSNPVKEQALDNLMKVTQKMIARGYDTFIMGCTEIPLAMGRFKLPVTLIDPAKILARALVKAVCPKRLKAEK